MLSGLFFHSVAGVYSPALLLSFYALVLPRHCHDHFELWSTLTRFWTSKCPVWLNFGNSECVQPKYEVLTLMIMLAVLSICNGFSY